MFRRATTNIGSCLILKVCFPILVLRIFPSCMHELELLEVFLVEDIEQVLLLPESSRVLTIDVLHERIVTLASKSVLLVHARPVHEILEVGAVSVRNGEHKGSKGGKLDLVRLAFFLAASLQISRFEDKLFEHVFHDDFITEFSLKL